MSSFTYEEKNTASPLESFEWDNVWLHKLFDINHKRVLYIGDSISCGIRTHCWKAKKEDVYFDNFGTSKALDNPYFYEGLLHFARQEGRRDAILLNNGLHGWHLDDEQYKKYYGKMIDFLKENFKDTPIILLLTTGIVPPQLPERIQRVLSRNNVVLELSKEYNLPTVDLYATSVKCADLHTGDGVHFTEEGNDVLADSLIKELNKIL